MGMATCVESRMARNMDMATCMATCGMRISKCAYGFGKFSSSVHLMEAETCTDGGLQIIAPLGCAASPNFGAKAATGGSTSPRDTGTTVVLPHIALNALFGVNNESISSRQC